MATEKQEWIQLHRLLKQAKYFLENNCELPIEPDDIQFQTYEQIGVKSTAINESSDGHKRSVLSLLKDMSQMFAQQPGIYSERDMNKALNNLVSPEETEVSQQTIQDHTEPGITTISSSVENNKAQSVTVTLVQSNTSPRIQAKNTSLRNLKSGSGSEAVEHNAEPEADNQTEKADPKNKTALQDYADDKEGTSQKQQSELTEEQEISQRQLTNLTQA